MQIRNVPAGTYTLVLGDDISAMNTAKIYLQCDTSSGTINILLPKITIPAGGSIQNWWFEVFVNDVNGNAATNNITITPNPANTISGSSSPIVLNTNGATGCLRVTGASAWEFSVSSSGGAGSGSKDTWASIAAPTFTATPDNRFSGFFVALGSSLVEDNVSFRYHGDSPLTLSRFQVKQSTSVSTLNNTLSLTIRKNGLDTLLSVSFLATSLANSYQVDDTNAVSIVTGDIISIKISSAATSGSVTFASQTLIATQS